jgi:DNA-binding beta-propeller fold protein YncE
LNCWKCKGALTTSRWTSKDSHCSFAALGNNTVEVIDLKEGKRVSTITGLKEPQGVLYLPAVNRVYVANGEDGSVRVFDGTSLKELHRLDYGDDADNLRYDSASQHIYVGFGSGALGEFDTEVRRLPR